MIFWKPSNKKSRDTESFTINVSGEEILLEVIFSARKTVAIQVSYKECKVRLRAPFHVESKELIRFAESKSLWIERQLKAAKERNSTLKPQYKDGAKHLFLGKEYTISFVRDKKGPAEISSDQITLHISARADEKKALKEWYFKKALEIMPAIIAPIIIEFSQKYGRSPKGIEYKFVSSYWGLCTSNNIIRLNVELIRAEEAHIAYIMSHELCHLIHKNHSNRFYELLDEFRPSHREEKSSLTELIKTI